MNPIFGFPSIVRFSWKTSEKLLDEKGVRVQFEEVEAAEDEEALKKNPSVKDYFVKIPTSREKLRNANPSHPYFRDRGLSSTLIF
jgi:hypothetical protein